MSISPFGIDHGEISKKFSLSTLPDKAIGSKRALKNITAQVKAGQMSLKDAQINANFAQKQIDNARKVQKSDTVSAFGVEHDEVSKGLKGLKGAKKNAGPVPVKAAGTTRPGKTGKRFPDVTGMA